MFKSHCPCRKTSAFVNAPLVERKSNADSKPSCDTAVRCKLFITHRVGWGRCRQARGHALTNSTALTLRCYQLLRSSSSHSRMLSRLGIFGIFGRCGQSWANIQLDPTLMARRTQAAVLSMLKLIMLKLTL